jgi:excisionase family DNA binding protein
VPKFILAPCIEDELWAIWQTVGAALKIYTADEIAGQLKTSYKTVLNLIKRGLLKALPGIRHKRVTEEELNRYLGIQGGAALITH